MKQNGFTLIELMITIIFFTVIITLVAGAGSADGSGSYSYGINGLAETRCIEGMKFVVGKSGSVQQILSPNGGGVACQ